MKNIPLELKDEDRSELLNWTRRRNNQTRDYRIARMLLLLSEGYTYQQIMNRLGCGVEFIRRWKKRYVQDGLAGLYTRHKGRKVTSLTAKMEAKILSRSRKKPKDGSTHWSTRKLAKEMGINHMMVARTWKKHGIKPHRIEKYLCSNDPDFEKKAADIIGLYLKPPQHALVISVDEKTAIQALDRKDPILPMSPGRAERHGFEYKRNGTLSLYAAFNIKNGEVFGKTSQRHTSQEFIAFLTDVLASLPEGQEVHIILDNLSAQKTKKVQAFLTDNPNVKFHFTPTYSSWLNQVELWFSKIGRDLIHRGIFKSTKDLDKKIMNYIKQYNKEPKPVKWKYCNIKNRIRTPDSSVTVY